MFIVRQYIEETTAPCNFECIKTPETVRQQKISELRYLLYSQLLSITSKEKQKEKNKKEGNERHFSNWCDGSTSVV
jgi:hypothetical protein